MGAAADANLGVDPGAMWLRSVLRETPISLAMAASSAPSHIRHNTSFSRRVSSCTSTGAAAPPGALALASFSTAVRLSQFVSFITVSIAVINSSSPGRRSWMSWITQRMQLSRLSVITAVETGRSTKPPSLVRARILAAKAALLSKLVEGVVNVAQRQAVLRGDCHTDRRQSEGCHEVLLAVAQLILRLSPRFEIGEGEERAGLLVQLDGLPRDDHERG